MTRFLNPLLPVLVLLLPVSSFALTIEHQAGITQLPEIPEKVAALNWTQTEILLSLGITPAGVTSIKGYKTWQSNNPPIPDGIVELGQRAEPGLEAIAELKPDLIIGYDWRHNRIYSELNAIAPTVLYQQYPSAEDNRNYFVRMQDIYRSVARIFGKSQLAEARLAEMELDIAKAKATVEQAGLQNQKVVVGKFVGMGLGLRLYGNASMAGALVNRLGLQNSWTATLPGRDFTHVDLLKLTEIGDASLIIMGEEPDDNNSMVNSPVWKALPAVQEGRVYYLPTLWSFGGPDSASRMVNTFATHLVSERQITP